MEGNSLSWVRQNAVFQGPVNDVQMSMKDNESHGGSRQSQRAKKGTKTPEEPESGSRNIFLLIIVIGFKTKTFLSYHCNRFQNRNVSL
jgi:hypothetical protein